MGNSNQALPGLGDEYALLIDGVSDYAIFLLSPQGLIRSWNLGAARIMGYQADEVIGRPFSIFYTDQDLASKKPERELEVALRDGRVEDEAWRVRKDGRWFWANTVITSLRDDKGHLVGFAKVTRDLTERRIGEERLRHSEELFRLLVESVKEYAIFMLDPKGNIATWNSGARRIKGYEASEIIGRHFSQFYPPEDVAAGKPEYELKVAREQGWVEDEGWRVRKDGSRFWANVIITAVNDEAGNLRGFAKVTRDVTERKQAEEIRRSLIEQRMARLAAEEEQRRAEESVRVAQEANRAKDEFLMTLSHELRTPMTTILGWARLLPTLHHDDELFREAIAAISRSAQIQARLIDDVLDVSRVMSGKLRLSRESVEIRRLLIEAIDAVRPMAEARGITIETSFPEDLGVLVADSTRIQQVIWNLLTNAAKFTPKGGRIDVTARRTASHISIAVKDTGQGIEPHFLSHVFEPFRQAESPRTRQHGGLGLGLSIVRYLVEAHGGVVTAESAGRDQGSTFTVTLPIAALRPEHVEQLQQGMRPAMSIDPDKLANLCVLIVDDDRETRNFIRAVMKQAGADVTTCDSARTAIENFDRIHPAVIVTDVAMPGMDGYELARALRTREGGKDVKIVALSAFPAGAAAAEQSGFDRYLTKPMDPVDLIDAIADLAKSQRRAS